MIGYLNVVNPHFPGSGKRRDAALIRQFETVYGMALHLDASAVAPICQP